MTRTDFRYLVAANRSDQPILLTVLEFFALFYVASVAIPDALVVTD
jgi:hypothetical protein